MARGLISTGSHDDLYAATGGHANMGDGPGDPPVSHGVDQTKIMGTPNSNVQGPETLDQTIEKRAKAYRESPNANLPTAPSTGEPDNTVERVRYPEHDGQKEGEGDIGLVSPGTKRIMPLAPRPSEMSGPVGSVLAPMQAASQLSDAEIRADPEFMNDHRHATAQDASDHGSYMKSLTQQAIDAEGQKNLPGQNMVPGQRAPGR